MVRLCLWLLVTLPLAIAPWNVGHTQQKPAAQATAPAAGAPAASPFGALSPDQARTALDTLNDPKKRAAFTATLEALAKAQPDPPAAPAPPNAAPNAAAPSTPEGIPIQLEPDSLGAQVLLSASAFLRRVGDDLPHVFETMQSIPLLWGWLVVMATHPLGQRLVVDASWRLAVALVLALGVEQALHIVLRRPMSRLLRLGVPLPAPAGPEPEDPEDRAERGHIEPPPHLDFYNEDENRDTVWRRVRLGLARFALQMVPVLGLLVIGHMAAATQLGGTEGSRLVILAVLDAIGGSQALLALMTLLFAPDPPGLQLLPIRRSAGAYLIRWTRRLILIGVPGYTIGEVALLLGLSPSAHDALQKTVGLVLMICLAVIVVQRRRAVRRWLSAPPEATGIVARLRNAAARRWYGVALFFLAAIWLAWTLRAPDAVERILHYFMATVLVLGGAAVVRLAAISLLGTLEPDGDSTTAASMHPAWIRLGVYQPALRKLATLLINAIAFLGLLQLYGLSGLSWLLTSDVGRRVCSGVGTLAVTIGLAFAVWEGVNLAIQLHLDRLRREAQAARSARLRTLLPLIHTTLAITVLVVAGLMVLSEIGVNIAPLLAGAGIVGVAIGFGSQKLVQDVITGVFLLLENTMQVGDVVKVGDQAGLVESLSVRTIRLRTEDGSVVVIPFSAVTTVINMTRDYSRAVIAVNIAADEDVDRVTESMRGIVRQMREEDAWSKIILDDLEVFGLDRITDTALQIRCRIMCTPFGRWPVGREFNRRLKARFAVVGIANPFSALRLLPLEPVPERAVTQPAEEEPVAGQ